jgi:hypothetical protein
MQERRKFRNIDELPDKVEGFGEGGRRGERVPFATFCSGGGEASVVRVTKTSSASSAVACGSATGTGTRTAAAAGSAGGSRTPASSSESTGGAAIGIGARAFSSTFAAIGSTESGVGARAATGDRVWGLCEGEDRRAIGVGDEELREANSSKSWEAGGRLTYMRTHDGGDQRWGAVGYPLGFLLSTRLFATQSYVLGLGLGSGWLGTDEWVPPIHNMYDGLYIQRVVLFII